MAFSTTINVNHSISKQGNQRKLYSLYIYNDRKTNCNDYKMFGSPYCLLNIDPHLSITPVYVLSKIVYILYHIPFYSVRRVIKTSSFLRFLCATCLCSIAATNLLLKWGLQYVVVSKLISTRICRCSFHRTYIQSNQKSSLCLETISLLSSLQFLRMI